MNTFALKKAVVLWFCALTYLIVENNYFGWNLLPQSPEEVLADGICCLLFVLSVMTFNPTK